MKRRTIKVVLTVPLVSVLSLAIPNVASASDEIPEMLLNKVNQTLTGYNVQLEKAYEIASDIDVQYRSREKAPNIKVQFPLQSKVMDLNDEGLTATSVSVQSRIEQITPEQSGYTVRTMVTTSKRMKATEGTQIYLLDKQVDEFDSSWDELHDITLEPSTQSSSGFEVKSDSTIDETIMDDATADSHPIDIAPASTIREDDSFDPRGVKVSSGDRSMAASNSQGFDYIKAVKYADLWTDANHEKQMNPKYPKFDQNCTNFVSQIMHEGGLPTARYWYYNSIISKLSSRSWMNAQDNEYYMEHTGLFTPLDNVWKAWQGSILYVDLHGRGIDHAMYVVGVTVKDNKANPIIDQKTKNRHQITLTDSLRFAHDAGNNNMIWYGLQFTAF